MRELKFRVWVKSKKKFIKLGNSPKPYLAYNGKYFELVFDWDNFLEPDIIIQQYTGIKDINGKEIYEGDIINGYLCVDKIGSGGYTNSDEWEFIDVVEFAGCGFYCPKADFPIDQYKILEIIGNIFENRNLLK